MVELQRLNVTFPLAGLDRGVAYRQQPPYSTPDCLNVRPRATIEGRARGGSRPGLIQSHITDLGGEVQFLYPMQLALGNGFTNFSDTFSGLSMSDAWSQADWSDNLPSILSGYSSASIDTSVDDAAAVLDSLDIDTSSSYCVEMLLAPWGGEWHGTYTLYLRLDDSSPDIETDGVYITVTQTGSTGAYTAYLYSMDGGDVTAVDSDSGTGSMTAAWLTATVSGTTVTVYWDGSQILTGTVDAHTGSRVGFGLECTEDGGVCLCNVFRVQYYSSSIDEVNRTQLMAAAEGSLWKETFYGQFEEISSNLSLRDDIQLQCVQSGQKLYIADYGEATYGTDGTCAGTTFDDVAGTDWTTIGANKYDFVVVVSDGTGTVTDGTYEISSIAAGSITLTSAAGTGNCSYRIERSPKVYDPSDDSISLMVADTGSVPVGCPLICRYLDRITLAGAQIASHVWYMSRVSDELDWDYSQEDSQRAIAGTSSEAGVPGAPITALIPHSDDYLVLSCLNEFWLMRGDPAYGGSLDALSRKVGAIASNAWTLGPNGELLFLSADGIYYVAPEGNAFPTPVSRKKLPREFSNIDRTANINLEYDTQDRGIHLFITQSAANDRLHWWIDLDSGSFWPVTLDGDHEPTATCNIQSQVIEESGVVLGCRDGLLRRFNGLSDSDCGTAFENYVVFGPIGLNEDGMSGTVMSVEGVLAGGSGDVTCEVRADDTFEGAITATAVSTLDWSEGYNGTSMSCGHGQAFTIELTGGDTRWAVENIVVEARQDGRRRLL